MIFDIERSKYINKDTMKQLPMINDNKLKFIDLCSGIGGFVNLFKNNHIYAYDGVVP